MARCLGVVLCAFSSEALPFVDLHDTLAASKLVDAAQQWGFAYITNHGVSKNTLDGADEGARRFFGLSQKDKNSLLADKSKALKTARGYAAVRGEQLDISEMGHPDLKEVLDIGLSRNGSGDPHLGANMWPKALTGFRESIEAYSLSASEVAVQILHLVAKGLGVDGVFDAAFLDPLRVQRLTRYPAYSEIVPAREASEISCGVHSDYGGVTLLHADSAGLHVLRPNATGSEAQLGTFFHDLGVRSDGVWIEVPPKEDTLVVMFGEALQVLSNGRIPASKHRVDVDGRGSRQSLALFYDPSPDFLLEPLSELLVEAPLYKPRIAGHKGVLLQVGAAMALGASSKPYLGYGRV